MNANAFRQFYDDHFAENRKIWDRYISPLSDEQFMQHADYSRGSVRDQIVHLMSCDTAWFSGLRGVKIPEDLNPADFPRRGFIRSHWDNVKQNMCDYLAILRDDMLFEKPFAEGRQASYRVAGASACGESWHRSSRTTSQITTTCLINNLTFYMDLWSEIQI